MYIFLHYSTHNVQCQVNKGKNKGFEMEIGKKLKELRLSHNLTQQQIADKLEINRVNYTRYETNAVRPDYETIIFYCIILQCL